MNKNTFINSLKLWIRLFVILLTLFTIISPQFMYAKNINIKKSSVILPKKKSLKSRDIGTIALGGFLVKDLLKKFQDVASRILFESQNTGDALMTKLGNQIDVATRNLDYILTNQQNTLFDRLSVQQQNAFIELNRFIEAVNNLGTQTATIAELSNLDLLNFINQLPLTDKVKFYVSSIRGQTLVFQENDFRLTIRGLGFGFDTDDKKYRVKFTVNGNVLPDTSISRTNTHELQVTIPNNVILSSFQDSKIAYVPVVFESEIITKSKTEKYSLNFNLSLLPILAGEIRIIESTKEQVIDGVTKTHSLSRTVSGCKTDKPCDWDQEHTVAINERIIGVRYECTGQCGHSYSLRQREAQAKKAEVTPGCQAKADAAFGVNPPIFVKIAKKSFFESCVNDAVRGMEYLPDFDILNGNRTAKVYRHVDGENSTTVIHHIDYQTLIDKFSRIDRGTMRVAFNQPFNIDFDPRNSGCQFEITGKLITKQKIDINNNNAGREGNLLIATGVGPFGDRCRATFVLRTP